MAGARASNAPDYGLDAPGVIRNLCLVGVLGAAIWATATFGLWSGQLNFSIGGIHFNFPLANIAPWPALGCTLMALWMIWDSKVGKARTRERLLDQITWTGSERVLDVGCGRGLMLIGAARRLTTGTAVGIDLWHAEDLSGNRPDATLENAQREGVADRVTVQTADMQTLPFPDGAFDVVVSCSAIHNLSKPNARATAIREIARVLKPGGQAVIDDIRHLREDAAAFTAHGCTARQTGSRVAAMCLAIVTMGSLRPGTLVVRKDAS
jgi:SAM-dependent methyltransferase